VTFVCCAIDCVHEVRRGMGGVSEQRIVFRQPDRANIGSADIILAA
jgi:hypothetical protein